MRISGPFMKSPHLYLFAVLSLASCTSSSTSLVTAPEPAEFKLSSDQIRQQAKASRSLGIVDLYADTIRSGEDEKGDTFHLATGHVLLVKNNTTPILAKADEVLLNSNHAEVRGLSVVRKGEELFYGDTPGSKITIDGVQLRFEGQYTRKRLAQEPVISAPVSAVKDQVNSQVPPQAEVVKPKTAVPSSSKPKGKTTQTAVKAKPRATVKSAAKPPSVSPAPVPAKPAVNPPKPASQIDRAQLLQLMREPE